MYERLAIPLFLSFFCRISIPRRFWMSKRKRCVACRIETHCAHHHHFKLVHRDRLDKSMWINEHVLSHYRPTELPALLCIRSIFHWTNETVNIWSHLLGFVYFTYIQIHCNWVDLPSIDGTLFDHIAISTSVLGAQVCMLLSASFHTFSCQSPESRLRWLKLDVFGISAGLLGMYLMGIYTSFFCFGELLRYYLYLLVVLFTVTAVVPLRRDLLEKKIYGTRIGYLHIIYSSVVLFGVCPTFHWVILHGGMESHFVMAWLPNIFVLYSLTGLAFFFYCSMVPERLLPGKFDLVGCSHQWWHLFILAAMAYWQSAGIRLLSEYKRAGAVCHPAAFMANHSIVHYEL